MDKSGVLSDRWNKKVTMLVCDLFAAGTTVAVFLLLHTGRLAVWHLYALNILNGLMNTVQQPASEVTSTLLIPKRHFQRTSGLRSLSSALNSVLTPIAATAVLGLFGLGAVLALDLLTFALAFCTLLFFIRIPKSGGDREKEPVLRAAGRGLRYLAENRGILLLILFLAAINLIASIYNAALPAMLLSRPNGGEGALGAVNTCAGLAMLAGSLLVSLLPAPKSRVRMICNALLFSMSTENFLLALGHSLPVWCVAAVLGWISIPLMNANMDVLLRHAHPGRDAGARLRGAQHAAVLHDPARLPRRRLPRGQRLRAVHGGAARRKPVDDPVRRRKGRGRRTAVPRDRLPRHADLPDFPPQPEHLGS